MMCPNRRSPSSNAVKVCKDSLFIFQDYLMSVVHSYPEFKQPLDVLNRYEALGTYK